MEDILLIGLVMVLVQIVKGIAGKWLPEETVKQIVVPLSVLALAGVLNYTAALVFTPDIGWRDAVLQGLKLGAEAGGVYSLGKAALGKS